MFTFHTSPDGFDLPVLTQEVSWLPLTLLPGGGTLDLGPGVGCTCSPWTQAFLLAPRCPGVQTVTLQLSADSVAPLSFLFCNALLWGLGRNL